ncbi:amino acid adenylation domain-containing protein [Planomonospora sp. ID67723]|uniref:non-ribosomal peptide synthetase n=1 Tax=Planomonospora sp. ID67723 TaxID=2738134 RepID=UPI0018C447FB|nr:non-ribosomal peptide synthetase [Planomonospora sp. ID67723]MBG0832647.1 amino acid adenylation domain-containing protein [Planomonospora sp. ID67723]
MTSVVAVPASYAQERFWLSEHLAGGGAALHNMHLAVELTGRLDTAAFAAAVQGTVDRHEALRTTLRPIGGRPHQVIAAALAVPTPVTDPDADPGAVPADALVAARAAAHARTPFDLTAGPLLRSELLRLGPERHVWLLTVHHAVCDGWSLGVLLDEIGAAYRGEPVAEPALQYADYAVWQRTFVEGGGADEDLGHWRRTLAGAPAALDLPADRARPAVSTRRGALLTLDPLPAGLAGLAGTERVTPFAAALAATGLLLHRLTGAEDVVIGTTHAGRGRPETDRLVGCLANTLPLRLPVRPHAGFRALLARAGEAVLDAQDHAETPFDRIVQAVNPDRASGRHPIFQVMLDAEPGAADRLRLPGVEVTPVPVPERGISLFDLSLTVGPGGGLVCEYSTELFDEATARSYTRCLATLTEAAVASPDLPLRGLPALRPAERERVLAAGSAVAAERDGSVPAWIEAAARRRPDAAAVGDLTWRELIGRAARLGGELGGRGVGRGSVVALFAGRSPEAIAAICGIHRAGAAYLPLDPELPDARVTELLARARPAAVVTAPEHALRLRALGADAIVLPGEARTAAGAGDGHRDRAVPVEAGDLAYVMFTSGSTGRPKAVEVPHGGLAAYVAAHRAMYALTPDDRVLQSGSLSFDLSAEEIFPCLAAGATLVPRTEEMLDGPAAFLDGVARLGVTVAHLPTSLLNLLAGAVADGGVPVPPPLRLVVAGSEPADPARLAAWRAAAPGVRLAHVYGVTEASMVSAAAFLDTVPDRARVTIGRPIAGTEIHVLDDGFEPVPDGVPGEIFIGGEGLARGYLAEPGRTAARFVPHPFAAGRRLYRTGDLARRLPDGSMEYAGRLDRQLSLRGFRIDPAESEAVLRTHRAVADAAVTVRDEQLVGYVVPRPEAGRVPVEELRAHAARALPGHLVPGAIVWLTALPRTGSGKIDVAALPASRPREDAEGAAAPARSTQAAVAEIWCEVLGVARVGPGDDFFQLGGHSLLAGQVAARLRRRFGVSAAMRLIFRHPRLADLAAAVDRMSGPAPTGALPAALGGPVSAARAGRVLGDAVGDSDELAGLLRELGVSHD